MANPAFAEQFAKLSKGTPDLERLISRIHAGRCRQSDFLKVITSFDRLSTGFGRLSDIAKGFDTSSVGDLIRSVPDISAMLRGIKGMYTLSEENSESVDSSVFDRALTRCTAPFKKLSSQPSEQAKSATRRPPLSKRSRTISTHCWSN